MTAVGRVEGRTLYLDPWTGVSGDMLLGALVAVFGSPEDGEEVLRAVAGGLGLPASLPRVERVVEKGVSAVRVSVAAEDAPPLRHLADMESMVSQAGLPGEVKTRSLTALRRLAEVEADIHGTTVDHIHFHEVGAADTLIDVVGTFALLDRLGVERVVVGTVPVGGGTVQIAHGRMGVPAPATARLLEGFRIVGGPEPRELTTPTGALLLAEMGAVSDEMPTMTMEASGYGAGTMRLDCGPNVLRAVVGTERLQRQSQASEGGADHVVELQTNLDDVSAEVIGHAAVVLRRAGALEVWSAPALGKKDRPATILHVLARPSDETRLVDLLFRETGTLGIRRTAIRRWVAERGRVDVDVEGEKVGVKWGRWGGQLVSLSAEYDEAAVAADRSGLSLVEVMRRAVAAATVAIEKR